MRLPDYITFTGADSVDDIPAMVELSKLYPIEWGILFSASKAGRPRYQDWETAAMFAREPGLRAAAHLCGLYAQQVNDYGSLADQIPPGFERVQVNLRTTGLHRLVKSCLEYAEARSVGVVLQCREEGFPSAPLGIHWLFDCSGGRGLAPGHWPTPPAWAHRAAAGSPWIGYAGGLGPDNVAACVADVGKHGAPYWLDMETGVRTAEDVFSVDACLRVCEAVYGPR